MSRHQFKMLILSTFLVALSAALSFSCDDRSAPPLKGVLFQGGIE